MIRVKVNAVSRTPASGALAGAEINKPEPGLERPDWTLDVRGWAVGSDVPVVAFEGIQEGEVLWRVPPHVDRPQAAARFPQLETDRIGFIALHSVLGLPPEFDMEVRAELEDGAYGSLGSISGERAPLRTEYEPRRRPIMITTFGRTGSMLLMRLLSSHPEVLGYKPHRFEQRIVSYWIDALLTMADPVSFLRGVAPQGAVADRGWWTGVDAPMPFPLRDEAIQEWLGGDAVEGLAAVTQQRIDALYDRIAATVGGEDDRWFAEKSNLRVSQLVSELYPGSRELFLVRDFRDMLCSVFSYNEKRGVTGFGRAEATSDREYVEQLGGWAKALARAWERRRSRAHVVRYEDLVLDPEPALRAALAHIGVDASDDTIRGMLAGLDEEIEELSEHRTTSSPADSVGRWRKDLAPDLAAAGDEAFGPALELFGYERS